MEFLSLQDEIWVTILNYLEIQDLHVVTTLCQKQANAAFLYPLRHYKSGSKIPVNPHPLAILKYPNLIEIDLHYGCARFKDSHIALLPRYLQVLKLSVHAPFSNFEHMPTSLKTLYLNGKIHATTSNWLFLPQTLNYLHLGEMLVEKEVEWFFEHLPRNLEILRLPSILHNEQEVFISRINMLPQSLVEIDLWNSVVLLNHEAGKLRPTLKALYLKGMPLTPDFTWAPNLQHLGLCLLMRSDHVLPKGLLSFTCDIGNGIQFQELPPNLRRLRLPSAAFPANIIPKSLTSLSIISSLDWSEEELATLPKSLTYVFLPLLKFAIPHLPTAITNVRIVNPRGHSLLYARMAVDEYQAAKMVENGDWVSFNGMLDSPAVFSGCFQHYHTIPDFRREHESIALCSTENHAATKRFLKCGAFPRTLDPNYSLSRHITRNPCWDATTSRDPILLRLLLQYGGDPNEIFQNDDSTIIHCAAARGYNDMLLVLKDCGADLNIKNWLGATPLQVAISNKNVETAAELLKLGAAITSLDVFGKTAKDDALASGVRELIELFDPVQVAPAADTVSTRRKRDEARWND